MAGIVIRLTIVLVLFFGCLGMIEESVYLSIAVFKVPAMALAPFVLLFAFLFFVGRAARRKFDHLPHEAIEP